MRYSVKKDTIYEKVVNHAILSLFFALLIFCGSWHKGIEFARYGLIPLVFLYIYFSPEKYKKLLASRELWLLAAFLATACIGLLCGQHPLKGVDRILNWILVFTAGFTASVILNKKRGILMAALPLGLLTYTLGAVLLHATAYIDTNVLNAPRLILFYTNPTQANRLIILCGAAVFSSFFLARRPENNIFSRFFFACTTSILFLMSFLTNARTGFAALLIASATLILFTFRKNIKRILFAGAALIVVTVCIAQLPQAKQAAHRYVEAPTHFMADESFRQRFLIWHAAWETFKKNPLLGHGFTTFRKAYQKELATVKKSPRFRQDYPTINENTNNAHNFTLHFLAETGVVGCLLMLGFWGLVMWKGVRSSSMLGVTIASVFLLSLLEFQMNMNLYDRHVSTMLFSYAGILAGMKTT